MQADDETGVLIIHRDIAGNHDKGAKCWCEPFVIEEDTLLTTQQIIEMVSIKDYRH